MQHAAKRKGEAGDGNHGAHERQRAYDTDDGTHGAGCGDALHVLERQFAQHRGGVAFRDERERDKRKGKRAGDG